MHGRYGEVSGSHFFRQPVNLSSRVAENDCLCDGEGIVKVAQCVEFPVLFLHGHEELLDAFQRQFITLNLNPDWVCHELRGHFQNIVG